MTTQNAFSADQTTSAVRERRTFMSLPLEERRRQMAEQASKFVTYYDETAEQVEREAWQGGDIVEGA